MSANRKETFSTTAFNVL